ncbi:hypothetical protein ACIQBJ_21215 [Kitasatospora sp. NPDC088391]|uniref:hypothetical protein n=1 Tax=Kitasatospora sp. NPDC088391 TaxID=3364074 RepID=UPI0037FACA81
MDDSTAAVSAKATTVRRAATGLAAAALAAGLLTACGGSGPSTTSASASASGSPSAAASPSASAPTAPAASSPTAGTGTAPSAAPTTTGPTTPGIAVGERPPTAVKIPATGYRQDSPTQLTVFFVAGVCDRYGVKVEEDNPPLVRLRVVVTQTAEPGKACPMVMKEQEATVKLSKPMTTGGAVVDTATEQQVPPQNGVTGGDPR